MRSRRRERDSGQRFGRTRARGGTTSSRASTERASGASSTTSSHGGGESLAKSASSGLDPSGTRHTRGNARGGEDARGDGADVLAFVAFVAFLAFV